MSDTNTIGSYRGQHIYTRPHFSGDWICLSCEESVADDEISLPENCPNCGSRSFGRKRGTGSSQSASKSEDNLE